VTAWAWLGIASIRLSSVRILYTGEKAWKVTGGAFGKREAWLPRSAVKRVQKMAGEPLMGLYEFEVEPWLAEKLDVLPPELKGE